MTMQKIACNKLRTVQFIAWYTKNDNLRQNIMCFSESIDFTVFCMRFHNWYDHFEKLAQYLLIRIDEGRRKGLITKYEFKTPN